MPTALLSSSSSMRSIVLSMLLIFGPGSGVNALALPCRTACVSLRVAARWSIRPPPGKGQAVSNSKGMGKILSSPLGKYTRAMFSRNTTRHLSRGLLPDPSSRFVKALAVVLEDQEALYEVAQGPKVLAGGSFAGLFDCVADV